MWFILVNLFYLFLLEGLVMFIDSIVAEWSGVCSYRDGGFGSWCVSLRDGVVWSVDGSFRILQDVLWDFDPVWGNHLYWSGIGGRLSNLSCFDAFSFDTVDPGVAQRRLSDCRSKFTCVVGGGGRTWEWLSYVEGTIVDGLLVGQSNYNPELVVNPVSLVGLLDRPFLRGELRRLFLEVISTVTV